MQSSKFQKKSCMKCKEKDAVVVARQRDPLCNECAYATALSKVRQALRLKMCIVAEDKIMVCLSGGFSSRALLQLLLDCQSADKSHPGRSKIPFELIVAHVDEGAACGLDQNTADAYSKKIWESVEGSMQLKDFTCLHLEDVYSSDLTHLGNRALTRKERRQKLHALIQAIPDSTGREDLVKSLREALLLSAAKQMGVTRLARGDSISRLAARVVACSAKGSGYALPSTLHYLDARFGIGQPMWISPVRELVAKDLAMITHFHHLKTVAKPPIILARNQASINGLAERFIAGLQVGMPSTVHAVLGTACKLQARFVGPPHWKVQNLHQACA